MRLFLAVLALATANAALAVPRMPADDSAVLERLPARRDDPAMAELRALRAAAAAHPDDAAATARLAKRYFELASAEGDPRYVGYAEAAVRRWPEDAPDEILYVRGILRQYRHDFDTALGYFARVLEHQPRHFGAHAWRAALFMVRAQYDEAARECAALPVPQDDLYAVGCRAYVDATTGHARDAYRRLLDAYDAEDSVETGERLWILTRLGEMAWYVGDTAAADAHFKEALSLGEDDNFLLGEYADFLLEQKRAPEVVRLLKDWTRSDILLLRLALAEKAVGAPEAGAHAQALGDRFAAAALRGERLEIGEEARYLLELKGDARAALAAALESWTKGQQREPRDALLVLEAALAAKDAGAAAPVLKWAADTGFESAKIRQLVAALR
ncbi:MAG: hypothetical protein ACM30H_02495 [Clostridia bacterium]